MKKLLLALPLIAGASWAGTTLYSGAQTQPAYNRLLEQLNDSNLFIVKSIEYEAGFTSSTAVTEVRLNDEDDSDAKFYLQHKISHSPVSMVPENARFGAANIVTTLVTDKFDDQETKAILESFEGGEPFVMNTDVAMDGATNSKITINKFKRVDDGVDFTSDGATINLATTAEGAIKGDGKLNDITVVEEGANSMSMSGSTIDFAYEKINDLYLDVDFDMNVDKMLVTNPDVSERPLFELQNAFYEIEQKLDNDNPFFKQSLGVKSLVSDFIPLRSLDFNTEFDGFSMDYILENTDTFKKLKTPDDFEDWLESDDFVEALRAIFTPDSALKLSANAETVDGGGDAAIKLWFVGNGSDDGYTGMSTTGDLAKAFKGTAKATVDRSALMSTPLGQMLNEPIAQIYLKITDDTVSVDATLEELLLNLNGQILPLEVMGGEAFQMPLEALRDM